MWIDRLVRWLLPRQDIFYKLLEEIAGQMTVAADVFSELASAEGRERMAEISRQLKPVETEADHACHRLYAELDRNFVTPLDREDLAHLTGALDDVIDSMEHAAAFAQLFQFEALTEPMKQLVRITTRATAELATAVRQLRKGVKPEAIHEATVAVHTLENEADVIYRVAIESLFAGALDARELVRQKDMLFCLEEGIDRCEDAMDVIRSVVVKNG